MGVPNHYRQEAMRNMYSRCIEANDWSTYSRTMQIESEWDDLSNELRMDYADFDEYEDAEWVLNSRIYDDSQIDRWS